MPSEAVQALSEEIDSAVESLTKKQAAGVELINEEVGDISEEVEATPGEEESDDVKGEVESPEVDVETEEAGSEEEEVGDGEEADSGHDEYTIERAVAAGIPVVDANALTSASLERVISAREQAYAEQETREQAQRDRPSKEGKAEEEVDPFDQLPKLDPDKYESEVIAAVEGLKNIARAQQKEIKDYRDRAEVAQETQNRANDQEMERWYDKQVADLGEDFVESLGEGNYRNLNKRSTQFANRAEIVTKMSVMDAGYRAQGIEPPPREDLFDAAARLVLKDRFAELAEKKIAKDLKKQSKQHIQRSAGSSKATGKLSPEEEAAQAIDARWG